MQQKHIRYPFFYALLLGVSLLTAFIFLPYMLTLAIATTFAVIVQPLYKALRKMMKGRERIAAALTILIVAIVLLAPLSLIGMQVVQEASTLYEYISTSDQLAFGEIIDTIEQTVQQYIPQFSINLEGPLRQSLIWVSSHIGSIFAGTFGTILNVFLGIIAFYYLLKDGPSFLSSFVKLSPLSDKHDHVILDRLSLAINSIIKGSLLIALIQGISSGIGFAIFGVPSPTLWGSLAAVGALVPGVGTALVIAPAVIYLFIAENTWQAVGLAIWGTIAVGTVDNFLGPQLVGRGVRIHPLFILFAVIGGIEFFGPLGFIIGPLVLSLLYALLDIYKLYVENSK